MLPVPVVKSILMPTPNIDRELGIQYKTPRFEIIQEIPSFESTFVKLDVPKIPSLKQSGWFVELPKTPKESLSHRFSRFLKCLIHRQ